MHLHAFTFATVVCIYLCYFGWLQNPASPWMVFQPIQNHGIYKPPLKNSSDYSAVFHHLPSSLCFSFSPKSPIFVPASGLSIGRLICSSAGSGKLCCARKSAVKRCSPRKLGVLGGKKRSKKLGVLG